jgi:hypothetical protein
MVTSQKAKQGRYQREGVLWSNEELNKKACEYVRSNPSLDFVTLDNMKKYYHKARNMHILRVTKLVLV